MKLTTLFLIMSLATVNAASFAQKITFNKKKTSVKEIFSQIELQSKYHIFYPDAGIDVNRNLDANFDNAELTDVLNKTLGNQPLEYLIDQKNVIIRPRITTPPKAVFKPQIIVKGIIVDSVGFPLNGAVIKVKGTSISTQTNANGEFLLKNIDEDAMLICSYLGYQTREIAAKTVSRIVLKQAVSNLEEVSVTVSNGYQTVPKERSAGSYGKPNMAVVNDRTTSMNVIQRLEGLIPGLVINNANPDAIQIRGLSSVGVQLPGVAGYVGTDRSPLVVVDGIAVTDINAINPNDIGDYTILRDATAASIWGSRAANGVIVITSKKGTRNSKIKVDYSGFVNFQGKPDLSYNPVLNSAQFIQAAKDIFNPAATTWATVSNPLFSGSQGVAPHERILYDWSRGLIAESRKDALLDSLSGLDNRSQISDIFYRNSILTNHTVSVRGGFDKYSFYSSVAYTGNQNPTPDNNTNSYKINFRQDYRPSKYIEAYLIIDLTNNTANSKPWKAANYSFLPYQLFRDASGNNIDMPWLYRPDELRSTYESRSGISLNYNPIDEAQYGYSKTNNLQARLTGGINVNLAKGLQLQGTYGLVKGRSLGTDYESQQVYNVRSEVVSFATGNAAVNNIRYFMPSTGGRLNTRTVDQNNWTIRHQLAYNKEFAGGKHQVSALAGTETQSAITTGRTNLIRGYNPLLATSQSVNYDTLRNGVRNTIMLFNSAVSTYSTNDNAFSEVETRFQSYYANAAYTFVERYTINGSWRQDKSSLFGVEKSAQSKPVYSVGLSWLATKEKFLNGVNWVNRLNLRTTYGITGNAPSPGTAASQDIIAAGFGSSIYPSSTVYNISAFANRSLTWESTRTINLGVDFELLNQRISGSIDLYDKHTSDLLGNIPANGFTGVSTIVGNLGDISNKGVEVSLNTINIRAKNFSWSSSINGAYNKNTLTKLNTTLNAATGNALITNNAQGGFFQGYAAYALFAYDYAGLDGLGDPQIRLADGTVTKALNAAKVSDMKFMGTYQPKWSGGFTNTFTYKQFSLTGNMIFNLGHVMRRDVNTFYTGNRVAPFGGSVNSGNIHSDFAGRWKQAGDETITDIPSWVSLPATSTSRRFINYYLFGSTNVISASYVKLRDVTLSYQLPSIITKKLNVDRVSVRAQMGNIMLWKANKFGIDPEYINPLLGVRTQLTNQHTFSLGANVAF
ncbi:SusC/RagA family TonB-linked outer membrane protein [Pedobacter agri]|uniref:SusC/RagA family TonB-linked outer membrane protein n=1 Tax=Pedobacter agri TaxID=454586 RepID=UPI0029307110|nr:SusC/RagA family TonB-linked outer membrane protein [Pedobacter agri]